MFALTAEALIRVYERNDTSEDDKAKILQKIYDVAKLTYDKLYSDKKPRLHVQHRPPRAVLGEH